jgi:uncharacterized cupin superfamily protein
MIVTVEKENMATSRSYSTDECFGKYMMLHQSDDLEVIFQVLQQSQRVSPLHYHTHLQEGVFVIKGEVIVKSDEEEVSLASGSYSHFKPCTTHSVFNTKPQEAELLLIRKKHSEDKIVFC